MKEKGQSLELSRRLSLPLGEPTVDVKACLNGLFSLFLNAMTLDARFNSRLCLLMWNPNLKGNELCFLNRPEMKREDPLNLSILLSGGKETNKDSPSNGE